MTTQDHRATTTRSIDELDSSTSGAATSDDKAVSSTEGAALPERTASSAEGTTPSAQRSGSSAEGPASSTVEFLFAEVELSGLRSRWDEVQSGFVDDPRESVQKADGLVSDVVDKLTTGFSEALSRLEEQWARGEQASTEDLRLALKRYREFFERLLAV
jgi:hypothetical protein